MEIFTGTAILLLMLFGLLLNTVLVVVEKKKPDLKVKDILLISMAGCHIIEIGFGFITEAYAHYISDSSLLLCRMAGFTTTCTAFIGIIHLIVMAAERYISIKFPLFAFQHFQNPKLAFYFIVPAWMLGIIWASLPLFGWGSYRREPLHTYRCSVIGTDTSWNSQSYFISLLVLFLIIPLLTITLFFANAYNVIRKLKTRNIGKIVELRRAKIQQRKMEREHFIYICTVISTYLISWAPYAVCTIFFYVDSIPVEAISYSALFAKTSVVTYPLVYAYFFKDFRKMVSERFCKKQQRVSENQSAT